MNPARPIRSVTPVGVRGHAHSLSQSSPFDLMQAAIMVMTLVSVWRIQDLFRQLNTIKIQYLAPALVLMAFLGDRDRRRSLLGIRTPLLYTLLGITAIIAFGIPTSLWPGRSLSFLITIHSKTLLLVVLTAASIRSRADIERYLWMHTSGAAIFCAYVVSHFSVGGQSRRLGELIYYDSNDLALLLVCTIPLCVYFLRPAAKPHIRLGVTAVLGLLMFTLVKTGSRGGFLALMIVGGYLLFNFTAIPARTRLYSVGALAAALLVFAGNRYWDLMSTMLQPTKDYNWSTRSGRKEIWTRGIGYMATHPITGVGAFMFPIAEGHLSDAPELQAQGIGSKWNAAHNSFIEIGAELGLIGLGLFIAALYQAWQMMRGLAARLGGNRPPPEASLAHALAGALVGYCVAGFFLSAGYSAYLYTIFALIIGLSKVAPRLDAQPTAPEATRREPGRLGARLAGRRRPLSRLLPGPAFIASKPPVA